MSGDTWHDHVVHLCEWLTLNQVSSGGNNERKKKKINEEKMGEGDKCHVERRR